MRSPTVLLSVVFAVVLTVAPASVHADGGIGFLDIAAGDGAGVDYRRVPSQRNDAFEAIKQQSVYTFNEVLLTPLKPRGAPGVAIGDFDGDGDLDIYVTNGPGANNSLYANQLDDTGEVTFVDLGAASGVGLEDQDSGGVCAGDIDNDGDQDLYVLGAMEPNRLLENQGDGTFVDITVDSNAGAGSFGSMSCSMGDIDGDGLLDIFIGNSFDMNTQHAIFVVPFGLNHPNQLLQNQGGNAFADVSADSGILETTGFDPPADGSATITWAVMMLDYDRDGDIDLVQADDQAAVPFIASNRPGSQDRGFIHVFSNDGSGQFTDRVRDLDLDSPGQWMGLSAGDVNCDAHTDVFGTNFGDYAALILEPEYPYGMSTSRFFYGLADGTFADPGNKRVDGASVFGWGASMFDYDNDGDLDILYHGGLDLGPYVEASNPGVMLQNGGACSGLFSVDADATSATDHRRRTVHGVAVGDLDNDGFDDVVSVSAFDFPEPIPVVPFGAYRASAFDAAGFVPVFAPTADPAVFVFTGIAMPDGTLSVELSTADNGNGSAKVRTLGSVGTLAAGQVNRDGVGATVSFTPEGMPTASRPVMAGASYASSDDKTLTFGMGTAASGVVDVLWPGGTKNRVYGVVPGELVVIPEIPCSYDTEWSGVSSYMACVNGALNGLLNEAVIDGAERARLASSALKAYGANAGDAGSDLGKKAKKKKKHKWWKGFGKGLKNLPAPLGDDDFAPVQPERLALGQALFFDKVLSGNQNISCATCHHPLQVTGDGLALGVGEGGRGLSVTRNTGGGDEAVDERIPRNSPALFNMGANALQTMFHDGRVHADPNAPTGFEEPTDYQLPDGLETALAVQAMFPVTSDSEMAGEFDENPVGYAASLNVLAGPQGVWELLAQRLREIPAYVAMFIEAFPGEISEAADMTFVHAANAIASFEAWAWRSTNSPFDRFLEGDWRALSPAQVRGMFVFYGKGGCSTCHSGALQTDQQFYAIAMPQIGPGKDDGPSDLDDFGLERVTGDPYDRYKFRTPSLRNVALTSPYGHSGAYTKLADVVAHHMDPVASLEAYDPSQVVLPERDDLDAQDYVVLDDPSVREDLAAANELEPVTLGPGAFEDLLDFLQALTDPAAFDLRASVPRSVPSGLTLVE